MLPRRSRLSREAFKKASVTGRRLSSAHFSAVTSSETSGFSIVVSKKVAPKAVTRHAIKRRVAAVLKSVHPATTKALILFPRASVTNLSTGEIKEELQKLLSKI